jgi:hypothetical protein
MSEIVDVTKGIVDRTKNFEEDDTNSRETDIIAPTDGKPLVETLRGYKSQDGKLMIYKVMSGRKIEEDEVRQLVAEGEIGPLDGFVSAKTGNRFPSKIKIVEDEKNPARKRPSSTSATRSISTSSLHSGRIRRPAPSSAKRQRATSCVSVKATAGKKSSKSVA